MILSKSRLNTFIQCPEKYRLHYELGLRPVKESPPLVEGSALHHLVETALVNQAACDPSELLEYASGEFWTEHPFEQCDYPDRASHEEAQVRCIAEAKAFLNAIGPLDAQRSEYHLEVPVIDPLTGEAIPDVSLQGYMDLLDVVDDRLRVIDIKTTARKPMDRMADLALELTLYAYLLAYPNLGEAQPVAMLYLVRTKEPKVIWQTGTRSAEHFSELVDTVRRVSAAISQGLFWKNIGQHCTWCDFAAFCFKDETTAHQKFAITNRATNPQLAISA